MQEIVLKESEMDRLCVLRQVRERQLTQEEAGQSLGLSSRQIRRLLKRVEISGSLGVKRVKVVGNRGFSEDFKAQVMAVIKANYADFGPTFAAEKLLECQRLDVNRETLRQWMMAAGLWKGRPRKRARIHQSRERRPRFGELVQIDGSHHDWFEGRAPKCCLLVFIDDATGKLTGLYFDRSETTLGYMLLVQQHLETYGRPLAYYSDKHSIFKTTREHCVDGRMQDTQLHRALRELRIELICAHSSQAKGRVERANQTLQDRLIKELRLRGISSIEAANAYMPEFIQEYNKRFAVKPASPEDAHRPVHHDKAGLRRILSVQTQRKLSKNLEFSLNGKTHQIVTKSTGYRLRHKALTICEHTDEIMEVLCDGNPLEYKVLSKAPRIQEADTKELNPMMDDLIKDAERYGPLCALPTGPTAPAQLSL